VTELQAALHMEAVEQGQSRQDLYLTYYMTLADEGGAGMPDRPSAGITAPKTRPLALKLAAILMVLRSGSKFVMNTVNAEQALRKMAIAACVPAGQAGHDRRQ
jgi:hypothetical protein